LLEYFGMFFHGMTLLLRISLSLPAGNELDLHSASEGEESEQDAPQDYDVEEGREFDVSISEGEEMQDNEDEEPVVLKTLAGFIRQPDEKPLSTSSTMPQVQINAVEDDSATGELAIHVYIFVLFLPRLESDSGPEPDLKRKSPSTPNQFTPNKRPKVEQNS